MARTFEPPRCSASLEGKSRRCPSDGTWNEPVGRLIYSTITSLDGYVEDADGNFDWARPDDELFAFINDLERPIGTYLYGRRMYETMVFWETAAAAPGQAAVVRDFAEIWRGAQKVVYSRRLGRTSSARRDLNGRSSLLRSVE